MLEARGRRRVSVVPVCLLTAVIPNGREWLFRATVGPPPFGIRRVSNALDRSG